MSGGEIFSLIINIAVGVYFAYFYPRIIRQRMSQGQLPRVFPLLAKILPPVGWVLIIGSVAYAAVRLSAAA